MKLVIVGATGTVGRQVVQQALEQGHTVTAFARNLAKLNIQHPQLSFAQGDVMDSQAVEQAIINVPLNNKLQALNVDDMSETALKEARMDFESRWNQWNLVRTPFASLTSALLIVLLFKL